MMEEWITKIARTPGCSVEELMAVSAVRGEETTSAALAVQPESSSRSGETFELTNIFNRFTPERLSIEMLENGAHESPVNLNSSSGDVSCLFRG